MGSQWVRLDCASIDTGWTGDLPLGLYGAWVKLLCLVKAAGGKGGTLNLEDLTAGTLARKGIDPEDWKAMLGAAIAANAVSVECNVLRVTSWGRYQKDATSADRQERYRERHKEDTPHEAQDDVTAVTARYVTGVCNGDVTGRDVTGRDVTGRDVTEKESPPAPLGGKAPDFFFGNTVPYHLDNDRFRALWAEWARVRKELRKPLTPTVVKRQLATLGNLTLDEALATVELSATNGWQGLFPERLKAKGTYHGREDNCNGPQPSHEYPQPVSPGDPF
jgi:hypothetical protein